MAECQELFIYTSQTVEDLVKQLSAKRYGTYKKAAGFKDDYAFQLYLYNARLAKSFLFPLHVVEVVLRNGIDDVLTANYGAQWYSHASFRTVLTAESRASLDKAVNRSIRQGVALREDVVAHLTFDFWSNLFRSEYDRAIWQTNMPLLLPHASVTRATFQPIVARINHLRNRIAHHEPIFSEDANGKIKEIIETVKLRSPAAAEWLKSHSTVHKVIRTKPSSGNVAGPTVGDRCDGNFAIVNEGATLTSCIHEIQSGFLVCQNSSGAFTAVLDAADVGRYILGTSDKTGLVDFSEHRISDIMAWSKSTGSYTPLEQNERLESLQDALRSNKFALIFQSGHPEKILGVIAKAHRRYG